MNRVQWRAYNARKQKEYRDKERGHPARPWVKVAGKAEHCKFCGMLLEAEYQGELVLRVQ